jgi:predicted O-methyltransferase YrrM
MVANGIKGVVRNTFPRSFQRLEEALTRKRLRALEAELTRDHGFVIQAGPFKGMSYVSEAVCSSLVPKLLGSYENELNASLELLFQVDYKNIIDVGCAEGYYAVGLALKFPNAKVYAFDIDAKARELCSRLAKANEVSDRVFVEGECDYERLRQLTTERSLIVCDCEGCEMGLLKPDEVPGFANCDFIVELHDMVIAGITPTIIERFSPTHEITLVDSTDRDPSIYPALQKYTTAIQKTAVAEFRDTTMQWAIMRSKG